MIQKSNFLVILFGEILLLVVLFIVVPHALAQRGINQGKSDRGIGISIEKPEINVYTHTKYISVSPAAFTPRDSETLFDISDKRLCNPDIHGVEDYLAPIILPDFATVTRFVVYYYNTDISYIS